MVSLIAAMATMQGQTVVFDEGVSEFPDAAVVVIEVLGEARLEQRIQVVREWVVRETPRWCMILPVKVLDSWPPGHEGEFDLVYDYSSPLFPGKKGDRFMGRVAVDRDGKLSIGESKYLAYRVSVPSFYPREMFQAQHETLLKGSSFYEVFFKNIYRGLALMTEQELDGRLRRLPLLFRPWPAFRLTEDGAPSPESHSATKGLDGPVRFLIDQLKGEDARKQLLLNTQLVEWEIEGSQDLFLDSLRRVQSFEGLHRMRTWYQVRLRFDEAKEERWRGDADEILAAMESTDLPGIKGALAQALLDPEEHHLERLARQLLNPDNQLKHLIVNRLAVFCHEPERVLKGGYESEEEVRLIQEEVRYWMERFGVNEP